MTAYMALIILILLAPGALHAQEDEGFPEPMVAEEGSPLSNIDGMVARFKVIRKNGGSERHDYTRLRVSDDDGYLNCLLICINAGYDPAVIDSSVTVRMSPPRLITYADDQITRGKMSGSHQFIEGNIRYLVTWHALDSRNATIEETQRRLE